jgi:peptidoglycan-associated lipoprotein
MSMKHTAKVLTVLTCALLVLTMVGCPKKCVKQEEPIPPPPPPDTMIERPIEPEKVSLNLATIHFDFDKSDIRAGDANTLKGNYDQIEAAADKDQKPAITVEGYCDPIGTSEYNMALGMRRAEAAKAYLVKLGVDAGQLATISYGEEKLVTQDEAQFEQNRRAEFKVAQ